MISKKQSFLFGGYVSNTKLLDKKIHENPKYKHVTHVVNSGQNIRQYIEHLKETHRNNIHQRDEVFKRMKLSEFVRMAISVAINEPKEEAITNDYRNPDAAAGRDPLYENNLVTEKKGETTPLSPFHSVIVGVGEIDLLNEQRNPQPSSAKAPEILPYVLLDVRNKEDYLKCHIITAKNYPHTMLCRTNGYETKELLMHKNVRGTIIILYDEEENISTRVASTLVQRGYDNVFILAGGLKLAYQKFPFGFINGTVPFPVKKTKMAIPRSSASSPSSSFVLAQSSSSLDNCVPKEKFTPQDIEILQQLADGYCIPKESAEKEAKLRPVRNAKKEGGNNASKPKKFDVYKPTRLKPSKPAPWK